MVIKVPNHISYSLSWLVQKISLGILRVVELNEGYPVMLYCGSYSIHNSCFSSCTLSQNTSLKHYVVHKISTKYANIAKIKVFWLPFRVCLMIRKRTVMFALNGQSDPKLSNLISVDPCITE
jgi:hypothetical protein